MISQSRWDDLINIVEGVLLVSNHHFNKLVKDDELKLILNVLKNNTPFQVVPDCCVNKTPNEVNVAAMNAEESQEISSTNVLLETDNFSVIDNGDVNV